MKKHFLLFAVMLTMVVSVVSAPIALAAIPIKKTVEIMPPRGEITAVKKSVCWQAVYDPGRKIFRQQIFPVNGADKSAITQEMLDSLATIRPSVSEAEDWQSFGFTCRPEGWRGFVDYAKTATSEAAKPLPKADQPTADPNLAELNRIKAELKAAKAAEDQRLRHTKPAAKPAPVKKAVKKAPAAPVVSPLVAELAACKTGAQTLKDEKVKVDHALSESQGKLKTAQGQLAAAEKAYTTEKDQLKGEISKAENSRYALFTIIWVCIASLIIGVIIGAMAKRKKRTP